VTKSNVVIRSHDRITTRSLTSMLFNPNPNTTLSSYVFYTYNLTSYILLYLALPRPHITEAKRNRWLNKPKLHRVPKKEATKLLPITFSHLNRFSKFFHCWIEDEYFQQNCVIFSTTH